MSPDDGETYCFGRQDCLALGLGLEVDMVCESTKHPIPIVDIIRKRYTSVPVFDRIKQVATGVQLSAFLDDQGQLWTCGRNKGGQLGQGDFRDRSIPAKLTCFDSEKVIQVAVGHHHMVALTGESKKLLESCAMAIDSSSSSRIQACVYMGNWK